MEPSLVSLILMSLGVPSGNVIHERLPNQFSAPSITIHAQPSPARQAHQRLIRTISITHVEITEEEQDAVSKTNCSSPASSISRLSSKL